MDITLGPPWFQLTGLALFALSLCALLDIDWTHRWINGRLVTRENPFWRRVACLTLPLFGIWTGAAFLLSSPSWFIKWLGPILLVATLVMYAVGYALFNFGCSSCRSDRFLRLCRIVFGGLAAWSAVSAFRGFFS